MKETFKALFLVLAMALFVLPAASVYAADINNIQAPDYKLKYTVDKSDTFIYSYNVKDYGAVSDGVTDNTTIFQKLLTRLGDLGGGTLYVPGGKYVIKGNLTIPKGVTLRGDWTKPSKDKALPDGTLLMAYAGRNGNERSTPFIEMAPETGLMDLAIWYPEQDSENITPYSPTIRYGLNNYFGNEYCNTKNVTLVNSYIGILFHYDNGGASPVVYNLYGTTLYKGIEIDKIADVGRIDGVHFSPDYWTNSGLSNAPSNKTSFGSYMKEHATGIVMRRNDWSYTCNIDIDGYMCGYDCEKTLSEGDNATPNGHHYNFNFSNCKTGIMINATNSVGILFDKIKLTNCETGISFGDGTSDVAQFFDTTISASKYALRVSPTSNTKVIFNKSTVNSGQVAINGGTLTANSCNFNNLAPQIYFGLSGRGIIQGCQFKNTRTITNNSIYEISISDKTAITNVEDFPEITFDFHVPKRCVLYDVTKAPYYASTSSNDNTSAIQAALNQAASDGGGIVFIPNGKYKVRGHLTVPLNVELRGNVDLQTVPHGSGTILEAYENRNNPNGSCFINLKANAGLRGIVVDYPEQVFSGDASWMPAEYPYTIQGQGENIYIINSSVRASYKTLDLFTYRCDNHYVDFLGGHCFNVGVKVGNNCENGKIFNLMFNVIVYACGNESKFGSFSNMPNGVSNAPLYNYGLKYLDFLILGDCKNEILYNDFHYGSARGFVLENEGNGGPSGSSMGMGIDGSSNSIYAGPDTNAAFHLYNSQVVALSNATDDTSYYYLDKNSGMTLNLYNSDYWGQASYGMNAQPLSHTTLNLYGAQFQNPGQNTFANMSGSNVNIVSSNLNQNGSGFVNTGSEQYIAVSGSTVNNRNNSTSAFKEWNTNQSAYATLSSNGILSNISRSGWIATASNMNNNAKNALDSNINTRWDTSGSQVSGQWFTVDFGKPYQFNTLILDTATSSSTDAPAAYEIYVSNDGSNWGNAIASGTGSSGIITFNTQNSRYVRILQTGSKSNYWSIHEFYAFNASEENDLPNGIVDTGETNIPDNPIKPGDAICSGNPIITSIFTADPSAHVWEDGRIYVYASHDMDPARGCDLMDRYHVFSSDNMVDWIDEGEILSSEDVSWGRPEGGFMWAPDCAYKNGTYYFYYPHPSGTDWNNTWKVGVATSSQPAKNFKDTGKYIEGLANYPLIDPCVYTDDDGTSYIYIGGGSKAVGAKLADDMVSIEGNIIEMSGLDDFHEASWVFKRNGIYYMMYADNLNNANRLRYATSNNPLGPWEYKGIVLDSVSSYTSHGSIVEYKGEWYLFYHNQAISNQGELRSVCVDKVTFNADGTINTVVQTDTGVELIGERANKSEHAVIYSVADATVDKATIVDNKNAYNGKQIGNLHLEGASFTLSNVNGGKGGRGNILIHYASNDDLSKVRLTVNETDYSLLNLLSTNDWNNFNGTANITVTLNPGTDNTITVTHGTGGANIDYIEVTLMDEDEEPLNPITISNQVKVEGYQISALLKGFRVISSVEPTINGQKVVRFGNIYGYADMGVSEKDMILNSDNQFVASYEATAAGIASKKFGLSDTATYFVRTMTDNGTTAAAYNANYKVRTYAILADGSVVYSNIANYSIYKVAQNLYDEMRMPNVFSHEYLYNDILKVVNADYKKVDYNWNNIIVGFDD